GLEQDSAPGDANRGVHLPAPVALEDGRLNRHVNHEEPDLSCAPASLMRNPSDYFVPNRVGDRSNHRRNVPSAVFRFLAKRYIAASKKLQSPMEDVLATSSRPVFLEAGNHEMAVNLKTPLENDWIYVEGTSVADVAETLSADKQNLSSYG
ncbi:hypothetical protein FRC08_004555, partial [Ceratobasidium sp. 394]